MDLKPLEPVMVEAVVSEVSDNCVALNMREVFGNTHLIVRPATVHASIATERGRIVEEIRAVNMPDSARSSVEAIINKHLGVQASDEIAPRGSLSQAEFSRKRKWPLFNPLYAALFAALIAALIAESAFQSYQTGVPFREWKGEALSATIWLGIAIMGVVRGLNRVRK